MPPTPELVEYFYEIHDLIYHLGGETRYLQARLDDIEHESSAAAKQQRFAIWTERARLAATRLRRLKALSVPNEARLIHRIYLTVFEKGLEGRELAAKGKAIAAAESLNQSAQEQQKADDLWSEMGLDKL